MKIFEQHKHSNQIFFNEIVDFGSYFGVSMEDVNSCPGVSDSGSGPNVRGPMDRFLGRSNMSGGAGDVSDDREKGTQTMTRTSLKEQRNLVCFDIGRFFF